MTLRVVTLIKSKSLVNFTTNPALAFVGKEHKEHLSSSAIKSYKFVSLSWYGNVFLSNVIIQDLEEPLKICYGKKALSSREWFKVSVH